jgi:hypothetical protein
MNEILSHISYRLIEFYRLHIVKGKLAFGFCVSSCDIRNFQLFPTCSVILTSY